MYLRKEGAVSYTFRQGTNNKIKKKNFLTTYFLLRAPIPQNNVVLACDSVIIQVHSAPEVWWLSASVAHMGCRTWSTPIPAPTQPCASKPPFVRSGCCLQAHISCLYASQLLHSPWCTLRTVSAVGAGPSIHRLFQSASLIVIWGKGLQDLYT